MEQAALSALSAAELQSAPCCALLALLGARVRVACEGGARLEGLLYSVDPETRTLLLLEARALRDAPSAAAPDATAHPTQGEVEARGADGLHAPAAQLIMAHAVVSLTVLEPASECCVPDFRSRQLCGALADSAAQQPPFDAAEAARRRAAVAATLAAHHVPFEETRDGALLVLGCLTLRWPFTATAASCPNARVLERITALLAAEH